MEMTILKEKSIMGYHQRVKKSGHETKEIYKEGILWCYSKGQREIYRVVSRNYNFILSNQSEMFI